MSCDAAETQLALTNESSKSLLERAGHLREERYVHCCIYVHIVYQFYRQEVEDKKSIITLFMTQFTLSDAEIEAINSRDVHVGSRFFGAMDKTERILGDCRVLMSSEDDFTKAGWVTF